MVIYMGSLKWFLICLNSSQIFAAAVIVSGVSSFPHAGPQGYQGYQQPAAAQQPAPPQAYSGYQSPAAQQPSTAAPTAAPLVDGMLPHKMEMKPFVYMGEGKEPEQWT